MSRTGSAPEGWTLEFVATFSGIARMPASPSGEGAPRMESIYVQHKQFRLLLFLYVLHIQTVFPINFDIVLALEEQNGFINTLSILYSCIDAVRLAL